MTQADVHEAANKVNEYAATLLVLDLPAGSQFGIDLAAWAVTSKFRGIKLIPPGPHAVSVSVAGEHAREALLPTLEVLVVRPRQIVVRRWDRESETLVPLDDEDQVERLALGVRRFDFDADLAPYPYPSLDAWQSLTSYVSEQVLDLLLRPAQRHTAGAPVDEAAASAPVPPVLRRASSASGSSVHRLFSRLRGRRGSSTGSSSAAGQDNAVLVPESHKYAEDACVAWAQVPRVCVPAGQESNPDMLTKHMMDRTYTLTTLLRTRWNNAQDDVLGEVQMAFVMMLLAQSYPALEQWKSMVNMLCTCDDALRQYPELMSKFVRVLKAQLQHVPRDFFTSDITSESFLRQALRNLYTVVAAASLLAPSMLQAMTELKVFVTTHFSWHLDYEDDPDAPVVVDVADAHAMTDV